MVGRSFSTLLGPTGEILGDHITVSVTRGPPRGLYDLQPASSTDSYDVPRSKIGGNMVGGRLLSPDLDRALADQTPGLANTLGELRVDEDPGKPFIP